MLADCTVASLFGNPLEICSKITGRVNDPPLQVWLVIWRAKQQLIERSTKKRSVLICICSTDRLHLYLSCFAVPFV